MEILEGKFKGYKGDIIVSGMPFNFLKLNPQIIAESISDPNLPFLRFFLFNKKDIGYWEFPKGHVKIKNDPSLEDALVREIDEEIKCKKNLGEPISIEYTRKTRKGDRRYMDKEKKIEIYNFMIPLFIQGKPKEIDKKYRQCGWWKYENIEMLLEPNSNDLSSFKEAKDGGLINAIVYTKYKSILPKDTLKNLDVNVEEYNDLIENYSFKDIPPISFNPAININNPKIINAIKQVALLL